MKSVFSSGSSILNWEKRQPFWNSWWSLRFEYWISLYWVLSFFYFGNLWFEGSGGILMRGHSSRRRRRRRRLKHMHPWRLRHGSLRRITAWCSCRLSFVFFSAFLTLFSDGMADPASSANHERDVEQVSFLQIYLLFSFSCLFPWESS